MAGTRRDVGQGVAGDHKGPIDSTFGTPLDLNLIGLQTLYLKEVRRFLKVPGPDPGGAGGHHS
ncbi:MAG: hypothetical protein ACREJ0_03470, partial [Geminicoccaceae bacterium]